MRKENRLKRNISEIAPEMISMKDFSLLTGISVLTLLSWKERGTLVPVQCGDMYSREQIDYFSRMLVGF